MIITVNLVTIHLINTKLKKYKKYFSCVRTLRMYSLNNFNIYSSVNYHFVHYIPSTYLSYNWKFVHFDHLHPILPAATCPANGKHKSDLFSMSLFVLDV